MFDPPKPELREEIQMSCGDTLFSKCRNAIINFNDAKAAGHFDEYKDYNALEKEQLRKWKVAAAEPVPKKKKSVWPWSKKE